MPETVSKLILKADSAQKQMVWAEVYAPNRPDSDGEFMSADTIEKMAHQFLRAGKTKMVDVQHDNRTIPGVEVVESFIARKGDPDFLPGAWVVAVHIPDAETWAKVEKGELNGFSVEALVQREERDCEIDLPPVVSGRTSKSEDHEHEFFVTYDEDTGHFKGGTTNVVNGHSHVIKAGTVTEDAQGHRHRFSSVDSLEIDPDSLGSGSAD